MDGNKGKAYLIAYSLAVKPILDNFLQKEIELKSDIGPIGTGLLESYKDMVSLGKGLRGALLELSYRLCGGSDLEEIRRVSTFVELYHSAILIHDDFMDRDPFRRGVETIHKKYSHIGEQMGVPISSDHYGNSLAVCIGDTGLYLCWKMLLSGKFPAENILKAGMIFSDFGARLGLGQALDMSITGIKEIEEQDVLKVIWIKSGEYTTYLPMVLGAALAGNMDELRLKAIIDYSRCLGWAFHIQDDILGLYAEETELGKPVGSDLREGKNTLLQGYLRKHGNASQLEFQKNILGKQNITVDEVTTMKDMLKEVGAYQHVLNMGWKYVEEGIAYTKQITSDKELQEILESLLYFMMERTK